MPLGITIVQTALQWITAVALIVTLCFIIKYTSSTAAMARFMSEEIGLRKKPVVSIWCGDPKKFYFPTVIYNPSMVHANLLVKATIVIDGTTLTIPKDHHYGGQKMWRVQAVGYSGPPFQGHPDLATLMRVNKLDNANPAEMDASITIESWAAGLEVDGNELRTEKYKNPTCHYYWSKELKVWVQEIAPN